MWERAQLVQEVRGRDVAVQDVSEKATQMPVKLAGKGRIEPQARRRVEIAHEEITQRLQRADRERRHVREERGAGHADRAPGGGLPRVRHLEERFAALRALGELELRGVPTTREAALEIVASDAFRSGQYSTSFLDDTRLSAVGVS